MKKFAVPFVIALLIALGAGAASFVTHQDEQEALIQAEPEAVIPEEAMPAGFQ